MFDQKPLNDDSSFRDISGFVFYHEGKPYRTINSLYKKTYDTFINSGLFSELIDKKYLIPHKELANEDVEALVKNYNSKGIYKIIQPQVIPFISYPYEWSFGQLKAAAILTLKIQELALKYNMSLKDASAYNVQFIGANPVFIDTLSFEEYEEGKPWVAYKQFCQHFLAPLALAKYKSTELQKLSSVYIDGIPLSLASKLLPLSTKLNIFLAVHIHLHAKVEHKYSNQAKSEIKSTFNLSKKKLQGILLHLSSGIEAMHLKIKSSIWVNYYKEYSYSDQSIEIKKGIVNQWIQKIKPKNTWDIGCNTGLFSELSVLNGGYTVAFDTDYFSIETFYEKLKGTNNDKILPLVMDITNPSSGIGWANSERKTLKQRGPVDLILALAVVHHLTISNNIPFAKIAEYFSLCAEWLIIEFVPKADSQTQRLLVTRKDCFFDYNQQSFIKEFSVYYEIISSQKVGLTEREIFMMKKRKYEEN